MRKKTHRAKRQGYGLEIRTFSGGDGTAYIVFRTRNGSFHTFIETSAKDAAIDCGSTLPRSQITRRHWQSLWGNAP
jgi:hypothetical protein